MKTKKFRKSRPFDRAALFPKKVRKEVILADAKFYFMEQQINRAFPNKAKRLEYIHALIDVLE